MRYVVNGLIALLGIVGAGAVAGIAAMLMAAFELTGSCFEGACAYTAVFLVFPLLWIALTVAFFVAWTAIRRRRKIPNITG
ncbi:hypothetical protein ACFFP0_06620 [Rhizobium puerariae]|uniref:Transmembrane protein n=1 Tax=Rhizobium puerariae TaxID=1585791 RepID=A0ABV6AD58_9HYPH